MKPTNPVPKISWWQIAFLAFVTVFLSCALGLSVQQSYEAQKALEAQ